MRSHTFYVHGMHCASCVVLTESELRDLPNVSKVNVSLAERRIEIVGDFGDMAPEQIARTLSDIMRPHGYTISLTPPRSPVRWSEFSTAIPIAAGFIALFIVLQKLGIVNLVTTDQVTYGTAFVIGLIASVSTCMAVVGGLVLSMSANFAKHGDTIRPHALFHASRMVSFVLFGGMIGALGSVFQLGASGTLVLNVFIGLVLLILGVNLLDVFPWAKKLQLTMPGVVGSRIHHLKNIHHTFTPLLVGIATFFLPCGFTQSMQLYTLTTGSFTAGALTMGSFALGTFPVLALFSFGARGIQNVTRSGVFFKAAGLVVIFFGLLNLASTLVTAGVLPPILRFV